MVAGGMFDEVPGLRVVLTECGVAWAAALRWSLDAAWELMRDDHPRLERKPSEYIDEHVWFTTQPIEEPDDPQHLVYAIEQAGSGDRLLFATDYPHWDFDSPKQALPRVVWQELRRAILCENALDAVRHCRARSAGHERALSRRGRLRRPRAPAAYDALLPYLSDYWRQYISEAAIRLTGVATPIRRARR